jgi:hypothetical protein
MVEPRWWRRRLLYRVRAVALATASCGILIIYWNDGDPDVPLMVFGLIGLGWSARLWQKGRAYP